MNHFLTGFADELTKVAARPSMNKVRMAYSLSKMTPTAAKSFLRNAAALGLLNKLISPDTGLGEAALTGGALEGGTLLGQSVGRRIGLGRGGRMLAGLGGAVLGARALHGATEKNRKNRARKTLYGEE